MLNFMEFTWFILIGLIFGIYAILDGLDLGVGILCLFTKTEEEKNMLRNSIGPMWDGNEVWLILGGAGLFAAFPLAYATLFSSLYLAVMLIIWGLILRALALEFYHQFTSTAWKKIWDLLLVLGNILPAFLLGVALGNILNGLKLDSQYNFSGSFFDLLNPFALITGLLGLLLFLVQGSAYLVVRTEDSLQAKAKKWFWYFWIIFFIVFLLESLVILLFKSNLLVNFNKNPLLWIMPFIVLMSILGTALSQYKNLHFVSLATWSITILLLLLLSGLSLFPNMILAQDPMFNITIESAASSETTLFMMFIIAVLGIPFVILYTIWFYKI